MANLSSKYLTIGLRRDENFNDLPNKRTSLNNLLNQLVNDPTKTFISEDLNVIRGIQNTAVTLNKLQLLDNSWIRYSETKANTTYFHITSLVAAPVAGSNPPKTLITATSRSAHGLLSGTKISVVGATNVSADGIYPITVIDSLTFSYTVDGNFSGEVVRRIIAADSDGGRPSKITLTYNVAHGLGLDASIDVAGTTSTNANGTFKVTRVPSPTTLEYIASGFAGTEGGGSIYPTTSVISTTATRVTGTEVQTVLVEPRVTLKDRVESARVVTGLIPPIRGGNGLNAKFIPSSKINIGDPTSTGTTIFDDLTDVIEDLFWDSGYFSFPSVIEQTFIDQYGGLQWEGYFTPYVGDNEVIIYITSTGLVMFEWDRRDDGNWTTLANVYAPVREIPVTSVVEDVSLNSYRVTLPVTSFPFISTNDFVVALSFQTVTGVNTLNSTITFSAPVTANSKNQIEIYDHILKTIRIFPVSSITNGGLDVKVSADVELVNVNDLLADTFDQQFLVTSIDYDTGEAIVGPISPGGLGPSSTSFYVGKILGETLTTNAVYLRATDYDEKLKIRISHWYPNTGQNIFDKNIDFSYIDNSLLPFPQLYEELPPENPEPTEIRSFVRSLVSPYQRELGQGGGASLGVNNRSLYINNSFSTSYYPVGTYPEVRLAGPVTITFTTEHDFITGSLSAAAVGSVIVPRLARASTKIDTLVQIKANRGSTQKITTVNLGTPGTLVPETESVNIINHKGFITWTYANVNGTTATILNSGTSVTDLRPGLIVIPFRDLAISAVTAGATATTLTTGTTAHGYVPGQRILITGATGITDINGTWDVATTPSATTFTIALSTGKTLSGVTITGTAGQFSCTSTPLAVNQYVTITGTNTGTGSITGYTSGTTYRISATNGTTTFTLVTLAGAAIVTTTGTPVGWTYTHQNTLYTANSAYVYPKFTHITSVTKTNGIPTSFTTSYPLQPAGANTETVLYFYADRGLIDGSKDIFCDGVFGQVIATGITQTQIDATPGGITQLTFKDVTGIASGQIVQLADTFEEGTLVSSVNTGTKVVTISKPIVKAIKASATVIFTPGSLLVSKTLAATAAVGATTITVSDKTNLQVGQEVTNGTNFVFGTTITAISSTSNVITISSPVVSQIASGTTIRFLLNREGCVMPKDTSPPFIGTSAGLRTGDAVGLKSTDDVVSFKLNANNLTIANVDTPPTISLSTGQTVNRLIRVKNKPPGTSTEVVYYLLASNNGS